MKAIVWMLCFMLLLATACEEKVKVDPTLAPRMALQEALDAQARGDVAAYISYMDFGGAEPDSVRKMLLMAAIRQKCQSIQEQKQGLQSSQVSAARMRSDSVATVFYNLYFNDGDSVSCSQKMVRHGGVWKLQMSH